MGALQITCPQLYGAVLHVSASQLAALTARRRAAASLTAAAAAALRRSAAAVPTDSAGRGGGGGGDGVRRVSDREIMMAAGACSRI